MSSWDDLKNEFSEGQQTKNEENSWESLARQSRQPTKSVTSQRPDNNPDNYLMQRMVQDMPLYERTTAQIGSGMTDAALSLKQLFGKANQDDVMAKRKLDAPLLAAPGGSTMHFVGQTAPSLAIPSGIAGSAVKSFSPALAPVVDSAVTSGLNAMLFEPVGKGESRTTNTALAAAGGALIPAASATFKAMSGKTNPVAADLAKTAIEKYQIPIQASDLTDSSFMKALNSVNNSMPVTGTLANGRTASKQAAFNRGVANTIGEVSDVITPEVASRAKNRMSDVFDDIYSRNPAIANNLSGSMQNVLIRADKEATSDQAKIIKSRIEDLVGKIDSNGNIDGKFFNNWQKKLREVAESKNDDLLMSLRQSAINGYNAGINGADEKLLSLTRGQYRNFKTIEPLIEKALDGNISPGLLQGRVAQNFSNYGTGGGGDLGELARIGSRFLVDRTPQTGGSTRAMIQNGSMLVGSGLGGAVGGVPGAMAGAALPVAAIGGANAMFNNNMVRNSMIKDALSAPQAARGLLDYSSPEMIKEILKRGANQSVPAITGGLLNFSPAFE